jgi:type IV secretion system protein VirD4
VVAVRKAPESFLGRFLANGWNRVAIGVFLFSLWAWGWIAALILGALFIVLPKSTERRTAFGSARWAKAADLEGRGLLANAITGDRYLLAVWPAPRRGAVIPGENRGDTHPLVTTGGKLAGRGAVDDGHVITVAGSGAGKGVAVVKPNLMTYAGSVVVLDPKGENFASTCDARVRLGNRVFLVDPFGVARGNGGDKFAARFNPMQALVDALAEGRHGDAFDEASVIADMIVVSQPGEKESHFNDKAKSFLRCSILFVAYAPPYQDRAKFPMNLSTVKDCFLRWFQSPETMKIFVEVCRSTPHLETCAGEVAMIAGEERASVLSTVQRHTEFLNAPNVRESLSASDFSLADLKRERMSIYLVLPATRLAAYSRVARLWVGALLQAVMHEATAPRHRVLFMLDEVAQLGAMEPLVQAVSLARGYGVDLWLLFQDMNQMRGAYGERWQTFFGNAKYQQFFGIRDLETAKYVSELLGKATVDVTSVSRSADANASESTTTQQVGRELLQPNEVMQLPDDDVLVIAPQLPPVRARKIDTRSEATLSALRAGAERIAKAGAA